MNVSFLENSTTSLSTQRQFATVDRAVWIPCLIVLGTDSVIGIVGNIFVVIAVAKYKNLQDVDSIFIINLAMADLYVTLVADPMSIVAKTVGEEFFHHHPTLCRITAEMCTIACTTSLMTIGGMNFSLYVKICDRVRYKKWFTKNCIIMLCILFYFVGASLVLVNVVGFGSHGFDVVKMECIIQTSDDHVYTVVYFVVIVIIPMAIISVSFMLMYRHVRAAERRVHTETEEFKPRKKAQKLAWSLFIIYIVFVVCWLPFALISIIDFRNEFHATLHMIIVVWAHTHSSVNWLIYFKTNKKFNTAFRGIFRSLMCRGQRIDDSFTIEACANQVQPQ